MPKLRNLVGFAVMKLFMLDALRPESLHLIFEPLPFKMTSCDDDGTGTSGLNVCRMDAFSTSFIWLNPTLRSFR